MSAKNVREFLKIYNMDKRIIELNDSSATVALAAEHLNCEPARIAKTLSLIVNDNPILIVMTGDSKIDNKKFKDYFNTKAKMIPPEQVLEMTGHPVGGVCPFAAKENVEIYLDNSLKRFETVFPACGSTNNAIEIKINELETVTKYKSWIDVTKV